MRYSHPKISEGVDSLNWVVVKGKVGYRVKHHNGLGKIDIYFPFFTPQKKRVNVILDNDHVIRTRDLSDQFRVVGKKR